MMQHDIDERATALFAPDTLLATQYFDRIRRRKDLTGEQRLMFAVLEDAVDVYLKHAIATHRHHQGLFAEAERWIQSEDRSWLYAFETICDYLGLDAAYVRRGLYGWKMRARGEIVPPESVPEVRESPARRRASNE